MKNILITGGAGYIGSVLTKLLLDEGYKVTVLDNLMYHQNSLNALCHYKSFDFIKGDICDYDLINKLILKNDIIIPLAAIVGAPACNKNKSLSRLVNYDAHKNIIDQSSKDQIIIFPNTNSGYGIGEKNKFCDENSELKPVSLYGKLKVQIEKAFLDKSNSVTLRLATVFGVSTRMRTDLLVNDFVLRALNDKYLILFEEHFRRNYIHIMDVANTFLFSIKNFNQMKGEPYNVGLSSANLTKRELSEKIKTFITELYIHSSEIGQDPDKRDYIVSNEKLEALGWSPNFTLDDGIIQLIKCYKFLNLDKTKNI